MLSLENRTGADLVLVDDWDRRVGAVPAGASDSVEVGFSGDCLDRLRALTADGTHVAVVTRRVAVADGKWSAVPTMVCEDDVLVVNDKDLVPAASFTVRNGTGLAFGSGWVGALEVGPVGQGQDDVVPLGVASGECSEIEVSYVADDSDSGEMAIAELPGDAKVCDGGLVVLEPWMVLVGRAGVREWQPLAPSPEA